MNHALLATVFRPANMWCGMACRRADDVKACRCNHIATYGFLVCCHRAYHNVTYQSKECSVDGEVDAGMRSKDAYVSLPRQ